MEIKMRFPAQFMTFIALLLCVTTAWPQSRPYPNRPVHLIVPYPPGGAVDPLARMFSQKLDEVWKQPVLIENKPGAGTIIGTDALAKSPPDGYTVMLGAASFTVNAAMNSRLPYDPGKDIAPITLVFKVPQMLVVNPQVPVNSVKELIDYLKARPGQVNYSSIGNGTLEWVAGELFKSLAGVNVVHVPYKGSGASMMSVISGETSMTFESVSLCTPQVKAGKLRALATAGLKRTPLVPNLPTLAESGLPDDEVTGWVGFFAPAGTPREILQKWYREIARILQLSDVRERLSNQGVEPLGSSPEYFADFIKSEISKWDNLVKQTGLKLD